MKKFMKALAILACAVLLVVATIAGTLAYLTDTKTVANTFTVGKVEITLNEAKVTEYGELDGGTRVTSGNTYKLVPGRTYVKDPTITVGEGSEECYIYFKVQGNLGSVVSLNIDSSKWTQIGSTGVYYYNTVATAETVCVAFDSFTVDEDADADDLATVGTPFNVVAYAVQTSTNFTNAEAAWSATFEE